MESALPPVVGVAELTEASVVIVPSMPAPRWPGTAHQNVTVWPSAKVNTSEVTVSPLPNVRLTCFPSTSKVKVWLVSELVTLNWTASPGFTLMVDGLNSANVESTSMMRLAWVD